ncbi:MAG TPA: class I SAM-dependent methyltransferase, partial [Bacteroidales bacterium]
MQVNVNSINYFNELAPKRLKWKKRNRFYHKLLERYYSFYIPTDSKVLEIGCGTGELLNYVKPKEGLGIDFSEDMIQIARQKFPNLDFLVEDIENLSVSNRYDYVIISDLLTSLWDIQKSFAELKKVCHKNTRIIISSYNILWEPILRLSEFFGFKS